MVSDVIWITTEGSDPEQVSSPAAACLFAVKSCGSRDRRYVLRAERKHRVAGGAGCDGYAGGIPEADCQSIRVHSRAAVGTAIQGHA